LEAGIIAKHHHQIPSDVNGTDKHLWTPSGNLFYLAPEGAPEDVASMEVEKADRAIKIFLDGEGGVDYADGRLIDEKQPLKSDFLHRATEWGLLAVGAVTSLWLKLVQSDCRRLGFFVFHLPLSSPGKAFAEIEFTDKTAKADYAKEGDEGHQSYKHMAKVRFRAMAQNNDGSRWLKLSSTDLGPTVNVPVLGKLKFESSIGTVVLNPEEMTDDEAERLINTKDENILQYIKEA
ncbi:hypothetical protein U1Q18_052309, partial [Sarracenia purpurea var. burkii]